ncbi:MAG: hypothetical protein KDJ80_01305 [Nitratireductor sp.]|nr:hypothetical protein [Nitratireductor sp.]
MANAWIGPVIIAALVSGLINVIGWFVTHSNEQRREAARRDEKIRDFMIALRGEIRSELANLKAHDLGENLKMIEANYSKSRTYSVTVPKLPDHVIFRAISAEIHLLPEKVIDPVVIYARQRQSVEMLVEDMRDDNFRRMPRPAQLSMYRDYLTMWEAWTNMAEDALNALNQELS